jgi:hypothetical protein
MKTAQARAREHTRKHVQTFLSAHPSFKNSKTNWLQIETWLEGHGLGQFPSTANLTAAFQSLKEKGSFEFHEKNDCGGYPTVSVDEESWSVLFKERS